VAGEKRKANAETRGRGEERPFPQGLKPFLLKYFMSELKLRPPKKKGQHRGHGARITKGRENRRKRNKEEEKRITQRRRDAEARRKSKQERKKGREEGDKQSNGLTPEGVSYREGATGKMATRESQEYKKEGRYRGYFLRDDLRRSISARRLAVRLAMER
jgi:hypothetical protein